MSYKRTRFGGSPVSATKNMMLYVPINKTEFAVKNKVVEGKLWAGLIDSGMLSVGMSQCKHGTVWC